MSDFIKEFISTYGVTIVYAILTAIAGFIGAAIKRYIAQREIDATKRAVIRTCVLAAEQLYKDLSGTEKYRNAVEAASDMLAEKGIKISDLEIKMLIEATVSEFNKAFESDPEPELTSSTAAIGFYAMPPSDGEEDDDDPCEDENILVGLG